MPNINSDRLILISVLMMVCAVFFLSCGIPNPLPEPEDITVNREFSDSSPQSEFSLDSVLRKSSNTVSGFNVYYRYTSTADKPEDVSRISLDRAAVQDISNTSPILEITDSSVTDEEQVWGRLEFIASSESFSFKFKLYKSVNMSDTDTDLLDVNEEQENILLDAAENEFAYADNTYLHMFIEYFVRDTDYGPSTVFSDLAYLGYIDLSAY